MVQQFIYKIDFKQILSIEPHILYKIFMNAILKEIGHFKK